VFENYIKNRDFNYTPEARLPTGNGRDWKDKRTFHNVLEAGIAEESPWSVWLFYGVQLNSSSESVGFRTDLGPATLLEHTIIAILLIDCIAIEIAEWKQRLGRQDLTYDDRFDRTWEHLSMLVDILVIFKDLPENTLDVDDILVMNVCSNLEVINPECHIDFNKIKKLPRSAHGRGKAQETYDIIV
jgi:hypothetical protein